MALQLFRAKGVRWMGALAVAVLVPVVAANQCTSTAPATEVRRGSTAHRTVALTFDAGSDRGYTTKILDTLKAQHIRAAFGMTGTWAKANPDLLKRIYAEGHLVLNHTYDHKSFTGVSTGTAALTVSQRKAELAKAEEVVSAIAGKAMKPWFRPPYGDTDASVLRDVGSIGYRYSIMWTVDSLGWKGLSASAIVDRCAKGAVNGAIYLMHVGSQSQDGSALPALIARLRAAGWSFARVDTILP